MLSNDPDARKGIPLSAVLDYFPDALVEVARLIKAGNDQHNPGEPIYWNRDKSGDEADALLRHFLERGTIDTDGIPHSAKVVWRALALFQKELEAAHGLPISRGSRSPKAEAEAAQTPREAFVEGTTLTELPLEDLAKDRPLKVGDRVRIVSANHGTASPRMRKLVGREATVEALSGDYVHLEEQRAYIWHVSDLERVP